MLIVMTAVNSSIPPQAEMHVFEIANLAPAIGIFGLMFVTLFAALLISKDRTGAFLIRLYSSPMKSADFILGYLIALLAIAAAQLLICMTAAYIVYCRDSLRKKNESRFKIAGQAVPAPYSRLYFARK